MRVIKLDHDTITILTAHKERAQRRCIELGTMIDDRAFVFSYSPDHRRHCDPDAITDRYAKMAATLGTETHLHAPALQRHRATRRRSRPTHRGRRLGHAGGGATTLNVYAAWVAGADTKDFLCRWCCARGSVKLVGRRPLTSFRLGAG